MSGEHLPGDYLLALRLALAGAADDETAVKIAQEILDQAGEFDGDRSEPVLILLDAIHACEGKFTT